MVLLSLCSIAVSGYGIGNFHPSGFPKMLAIHSCTLYAYECMAQLCSILFVNPLLAMLLYLMLWFASFLFSGLLVPVDDVTWPFRALCYVLPLGWSLRTMAGVEFRDTLWEGAVLCPTSGEEGCSYHADGDGNEILPGWTCGPTGLPGLCSGRTGAQVLDTLSLNYKQFTSRDTTGDDILYCIVIGIFCKICSAYLLNKECSKEAKIESLVDADKGKWASRTGKEAEKSGASAIQIDGIKEERESKVDGNL